MGSESVWEDHSQQTRAIRSLGDMPLVVLTAEWHGFAGAGEEAWLEMQQESGHAIQHSLIRTQPGNREDVDQVEARDDLAFLPSTPTLSQCRLYLETLEPLLAVR